MKKLSNNEQKKIMGLTSFLDTVYASYLYILIYLKLRRRKMTESLGRPELWISEVLRINSHFGGIHEPEFGYSQLSSIIFGGLTKDLLI